MPATATILADASYCPRTGAGGWGYWIASDRGKRGGGGPLRSVSCSQTAEMMAIVNALHVAIQAKLVCEGDKVLIQTDCIMAIAALNGRYKYADVDRDAVCAGFQALTRGLKVSFKHVKGHTCRNARPEARFGANRACDARAKQHMRAARARMDGHHFQEEASAS